MNVTGSGMSETHLGYGTTKSLSYSIRNWQQVTRILNTSHLPLFFCVSEQTCYYLDAAFWERGDKNIICQEFGMRKIKLQMQITVDSFVAGPNGEMDWMALPWTEDINAYVDEIFSSVDTIVLGRKLAEGFIPYWAGIAANPDDPEFISGKRFTDTSKVVFTKTLDQSAWDNTVLAKDNLVDEITKLKNQDGKDIIAYGGATFVSSLIKHGLIDEYYLFINPTAIGNGLTIFSELGNNENLTLVKSSSFDCGIVALHYLPAKMRLG